jgi:hypothetical protein
MILLMMEAARTSETLVNFYQTTRHYNPEDSRLNMILLYKHFRLNTVVRRNYILIITRITLVALGSSKFCTSVMFVIFKVQKFRRCHCKRGVHSKSSEKKGFSKNPHKIYWLKTYKYDHTIQINLKC